MKRLSSSVRSAPRRPRVCSFFWEVATKSEKQSLLFQEVADDGLEELELQRCANRSLHTRSLPCCSCSFSFAGPSPWCCCGWPPLQLDSRRSESSFPPGFDRVGGPEQFLHGLSKQAPAPNSRGLWIRRSDPPREARTLRHQTGLIYRMEYLFLHSYAHMHMYICIQYN